MTTPAQTQPASPLEQWFDAKLRPVLLEQLAAADGGAAALSRDAPQDRPSRPSTTG